MKTFHIKISENAKYQRIIFIRKQKVQNILCHIKIIFLNIDGQRSHHDHLNTEIKFGQSELSIKSNFLKYIWYPFFKILVYSVNRDYLYTIINIQRLFHKVKS